MLQSIRSLAPFLEMTSAMFGPKPDQWAGGSARDTQMGTNLAFLAQRMYPQRKLIVWCATFHALHDANTIYPVGNAKMYETTVTAGEVARAELGEQMYTIGFEAHTGQAGAVFRPQPTTLPTSPTRSIGAALAEHDGRFLFLDFRGLSEGHALRKPQVTRQLGYMPATAVWPQQVDGIVFIREMFPSTREALKPEDYELSD
jgi:erythromycin esterase